MGFNSGLKGLMKTVGCIISRNITKCLVSLDILVPNIRVEHPQQNNVYKPCPLLNF
jgi:hypothetical protein